MNYFLHAPMADPGTELGIDETAFNDLDTAKSSLLAILGFEECFALLFDNYTEFEEELVRLALDQMLRPNPLNPATGYAAIHAINRRLLNLLTAYSFYCESAQKRLPCLGCIDKQGVWAEFTAEFKSNCDLALAKELRNYAGHHGVLISGISYPSGWEDRNGQDRQVMRFGIFPIFDRSDIKSYNPKLFFFDGPNALGDPTYCVRRIIEGVGAIHERLRTRHVEPLAESKKMFHQALQRFEGQPELVFAVHPSKQIAISRSVIERIDDLQESYGVIPAVSQRYVSNESSQLR